MKISGFTESAAAIFVVSPGRCSSPAMFNFLFGGADVTPLLLVGLPIGNGGGGLKSRFNFSRKARCAFRLGDGPRTFGFFMSILQMSIYEMLHAIGAVSFIG